MSCAQKTKGPEKLELLPDHSFNHPNANEENFSVNTNTTLSPNGSRNPYSVCDANVDASNLSFLLITIREIMSDLDYGQGSERNVELERAFALVDIGSECAKRLADGIDRIKPMTEITFYSAPIMSV